MDALSTELILGVSDPGPPLWPIVLPALLTLGGVALGRFWDLFGEKGRWKRDQMSKAYAEFSGCADAFFVEVSVDDDHTDWQRAQNAYVGLTQAGAMVDIYGSTTVIHAAHRLWNWAMIIMNDWAGYEAMSEEAWAPRAEAFRSLLLEFTNGVRADIGDGKQVTVTDDGVAEVTAASG